MKEKDAMVELRIHGFGGQGAVTLTKLLTQIAMYDEKKSQALTFYGVERRGAPVVSLVRISEEEILQHSQSYEPDYIVVLDDKLKEPAIEFGKKSTTRLIINQSDKQEKDFDGYQIDAVELAVNHQLIVNNEPLVNIPMLGAICRIVGLSVESLSRVINEKWGMQKGNIYIDVACKGYEMIK